MVQAQIRGSVDGHSGKGQARPTDRLLGWRAWSPGLPDFALLCFPQTKIARTVALPSAVCGRPRLLPHLLPDAVTLFSLPSAFRYTWVSVLSLAVLVLWGQFYLSIQALSSLRTGTSWKNPWMLSLSPVLGAQTSITDCYGPCVIIEIINICGVSLEGFGLSGCTDRLLQEQGDKETSLR